LTFFLFIITRLVKLPISIKNRNNGKCYIHKKKNILS
jgi:hypothetical protein